MDVTSSRQKKRILALAAVFIAVIIAGYWFRVTLHYLWLTSVAAPLADASLSAANDDVEFYEARIVRRIPHNPNSFVQGLQLIGDAFYEGMGLRGESALVRHHFDRQAGTLNTVWRKELPASEFGEGVAVSDGVIYQLTWKEGQVHRYRDHDTSPTELTGFANDREGWGLTTDGGTLIASDGSDTVFFRSPEDFSVIRTLEVHHRGRPVMRLNELEFINGEIWANLWMSQYVVSIDPSSGAVTAIIDCAALIADAKTTHPDIDYLNGIAWDEVNQHLYLTGKLWPWIYQVALDAKP